MEKNRFIRHTLALTEAEPSPALYHAVLHRIDHERARQAKFRLAGLLALALASLGALVPAFHYTAQEFARTGVFQYASLLFSDGSLMATYWREFVMTVIESIPVLGVVFMLSAVGTFLASMILALKNMRIVMLEYRY
ncbi:hypothetical protein KGO95_00305 [Patescibacteria group bacterium]|nr:hypothetical protein [Patescibacteria group bacterium]